MTVKVEFYDDIPRPTKGPQRYTQFAKALKANPGKWAIMPYSGKSSAGQVAYFIRRGKYGAFTSRDFEASSRGDEVWVRYVGSEQ